MTVSTYTEKDLNSILANKIQSITAEGWLIDSSVNRKCSPNCTFQISFTNSDGETKVLFVEKTDKTHAIIEEDLSKNKNIRKAVCYTKNNDGSYIETSTSKSSSVEGVSFKSFINDTPHPQHRLSDATDTKIPTPNTCPLSCVNNSTDISKEDNEGSELIPSIRDMIHKRANRFNWLRRRKLNKKSKKNKERAACQQEVAQEYKEKTLADYINTDNSKKPETKESYLRRKTYEDGLYDDFLTSPLRDMINTHRELENIFRRIFWF